MSSRNFSIAAGLAAMTLLSVDAYADHTAYVFPMGIGNQHYGGSLGMDFDVNSDITVSALGVFDSLQDGLKNNINVYIYNRATQSSVALLAFGPSQGGVGIGASVFRNLATPLLLKKGFQGSIVAEGYGVLELDGNSNLPGVNYATTLDDAGGAISFVGNSRFGNFGAYPTSPDFAVAKYGAGTFQYSVVPAPEPASVVGLVVGVGLFVRRRRRGKG